MKKEAKISPWEGETFYEGARGRFFESLFQREAKFAQSGRLFSWRAQGRGFLNSFCKGKRNFPWRGGSFLGGPRGDSESPPLGPSKPPVTPLKRAAQRGPAGPLAATGFPRRRTGLIKVGNNFPYCTVLCGSGRQPSGLRAAPGRLKGVMGGVEGFKGEDTELPLIPPHFAAHSGQFLLPFAKGIQPSPWPLHKIAPRQGNFASLCKRDSESPLVPSQLRCPFPRGFQPP